MTKLGELEVIIFLGLGFAILLCLYLVLRKSLIIALVISQSMSPTLEIGDRILAIRQCPIHWLHKGQIVLFKPPPCFHSPRFGSSSEIPLVKRIVGLPGDTIPSIQTLSLHDDASSRQAQIIAPGYFFAKGDLFVNENDLSIWGPIPFDHLLAVVIMKLPRRKDGPFALLV